MKSRKIIALLCSVIITISLITLPIYSTATEITLFKQCIFSDEFNTAGSTDSWVLGERRDDTYVPGKEVTLSQKSLTDGTGVLELYSSKHSTDAVSFQPTAFKDFDDITFVGNKIIIETRFKTLGGTNASSSGSIAYLKFNRPNSVNILRSVSSSGGFLGQEGGLFFRADNTGVAYKSSSYSKAYITDGLVPQNDSWVNAKIVIDGSNGSNPTTYTLTTWADNDSENAKTATGVLRENNQAFYDFEGYYNNGSTLADDAPSAHTALKNLTFMIRDFSNTLQIDYIRLYNERPLISATAEIMDTYVGMAGPVRVKLNTECSFDTLPKDAIYIDGVETNVSYNKSTKIVTLTPKTPFNSGAHHAVKITPSVLESGLGLSFSGVDTFEFDVTDVSVENLTILGDSNNGSVITISDYLWTSTLEQGNHIFQWEMSDDGEEDTFADIEGATSDSFTVTPAQAKKYIRLRMIPYALNGYSGSVVYSNIIIPTEDPVFKKYIIKDEFNTAGNTDSWVLGEIGEETGKKVTLDQYTFEDGTGALKLYSSKHSKEAVGYQPNAFRDFDDVDFEGKELIIETRFKTLGGANTQSRGSVAYLKFNMPNNFNAITSITSSGGLLGQNGGSLLRVDNTAGVSYKSSKYSMSSVDTGFVPQLDEWVNAKIVIDGTEGGNPTTYTLTTWLDGKEDKAKVATGTLEENNPAFYDIESYYNNGNTLAENASTAHSALKNFSFMIRDYSNTVYVDYLRMYYYRTFVTVTASISENYIRVTDPVKITFDINEPFEVLPEGAVYIDGVESTVTYDKLTKTATLTPKNGFEAGGHYTVKLNPVVFAEAEGITIAGQTSFDFDVSNVNVDSLTAKGRIIAGNILTSSYRFISSYEEGDHLYQWQISSTGEENSFSDIAGAVENQYIVDAGDYGKHIRLKMIPYAINGECGLTTYSNVITPETKPEISNIVMDTFVPFTNMYLSASYDYYDEQNDSEGETEIIWYTSESDSVDGEWTPIHTGKAYYITENEKGKYIKCTITPVANSVCESRGETVTSSVAGPVVDIYEATNLFTNHGFETGLMGDWKMSETSWEGVKIQTTDVHNGNYGLELTSRPTVNETYGQDIEVTAGKNYLLGVWAKKTSPSLKDVPAFTPYAFGSLVSRNDPTGYESYTLTNNWTHAVSSFLATSSGSCRFGAVSFEARFNGLENAYLDDFYLGEVIITDIELNTLEPVTIPVSGEKVVQVTSGKLTNQLNTRHGLWNEKVEISIPSTQGVRVEGTNLIVTDTAMPGTITVEIFCKPSYVSNQKIFRKFVDIQILPHNDYTPRVSNVKVTGSVIPGQTLTGEYDYYQIQQKTDASDIVWMYSDSEDGIYYPIDGANTLTYTVESAYAEKYIKMAVIPKTLDGIKGEEARSPVVTKPRVPVATDVLIDSKVFNVGDTVSGKYTYYDVNRDVEGDSLYKWYVSDSENGMFTQIAGANNKTLILTEKLVDKYIKFGVTPVSTVAPYFGKEVLSEAYRGPSAPVATNVSITRQGSKFIGNYNYYHPHNAREDGTIYKWIVNGITVSDEISCVIDSAGTKTIVFSVTPVADSNPAKGKTVSATVIITNNNNSSGGGAGGSFGGGGSGGASGGGGGAGFSSGVTNINNMQIGTQTEEKNDNNKEEKTSDITNHWGKAYIQEMEKRGVMKADNNGNFNPDKIVARSEMITYLFDVLNLEESEYTAEFSDVSAKDDFAGKLQTMINNGTISSYHEFRPSDGISREEMCKILYISLENAGKLTKAETNILDVFEDKALISEWAIDYVNTIYSNKIMIGTTDTSFAPCDNLTKAQAATLLARIIKLIEAGAENE